LYDSVVETITSYVCFEGCKVAGTHVNIEFVKDYTKRPLSHTQNETTEMHYSQHTNKKQRKLF